ncbi:MAG: hypothetical protein AB1486_13145 [Planctomycetota bacterium]
MVRASFLGRWFRRKSPDNHKGRPGMSSGEGSSPGAGAGVATLERPSQAVSPRGRVESSRLEKGSGRPLEGDVVRRHVAPAKPVVAERLEPRPTPGAPADRVEVPSERPHKVEAAKMSAGEEIGLKISEGLKGLSSILTDIDHKLDDQSRKSTELVETVKVIPEVMKDLPETSRAGVELLSLISRALERQASAAQEVTSRVREMTDKVQGAVEGVGKVPVLLADLGERIEQRVAGADAQRERLGEKVAAVQRTVQELSSEHLRAHQYSLEELRRLNERQNETLKHLADRSRLHAKILGGLLFVVVLAFIALLTKF